jgi:hypothetical protein
VEIFRCDVDGRVLYTDTPCKKGTAVQIDPGSADPEAVRQLERARQSLEVSADRRLAAMERAAERRSEHEMPSGMQEDSGNGENAPGTVAADYGYGAAWYGDPRPAHPRKRPQRLRDRERRIAPPPPYVVPRS